MREVRKVQRCGQGDDDVPDCADNAENAGKCIEVFANPAKIGGNIDICWRDCWLEWFRGLYLQSTCRRAGRLR